MEIYVAGHEEVERLLPMAECIDVMEEALKTLARGEAVLPLRQAVRQPDGKGLLGLMPAYLGQPRVLGAKVVTVFGGNFGTPYESHQGSVLLYECEHGRPLAIVDAGAITTIRTGAVTAVATRALARAEASNLALLGSGTQAIGHLEAMCAVRPITSVRVWSRSIEHAQKFAEREAARRNLDIRAVSSAEAAVRDADIICTLTPATAPILRAEWLAPGAHVNAIGSSVPGYRETETAVVARSRVFVDRRESALNEADDIRIPLREGVIGEEHIRGEIGEVLLGRVPGRANETEVTLFKALGLAIEDLAAAYHVYAKGKAQGVGTSLEFTGQRHG